MAARFNIDVQELSLRQILIIAGALYAACLPVFAYGQWSYTPVPLPDGAAVEMLTSFKSAPNGRYVARIFKFVREKHVENGKIVYKDFAKPKPLVVYEDMTELPPERYEIQRLKPDDTWRYVWIKTSDGLTPKGNGHRYYVVMKRQPATESAAR